MTSKRRVAIIGTGLIGGGWVLHFLRMGWDVTAHDPAEGAEARLNEMVDRDWPLMKQMSLFISATPDRLTFCDSLEEALDGVSVVLECAPERLEVKQALFEEMDRIAPPEVLLFSCTSSFTISEIRKSTANPERCLLGHPFNPPHILPLVEVAGGARDSEPVRRSNRSLITWDRFNAVLERKPLPAARVVHSVYRPAAKP